MPIQSTNASTFFFFARLLGDPPVCTQPLNCPAINLLQNSCSTQRHVIFARHLRPGTKFFAASTLDELSPEHNWLVRASDAICELWRKRDHLSCPRRVERGFVSDAKTPTNAEDEFERLKHKEQMQAFHAPLHPLDSEAQTPGFRHTAPFTCGRHSVPRACAFVRKDNICLSPPKSWKMQF